MKIIIFISIISIVYNIIYIPKYGEYRFEKTTDIFYLNVSEFNQKTIHIQMNAHNGVVDEDINYDFTDQEPSDSFIASRRKWPASSWHSSSSVNGKVKSFTYKYYYEIKKDSSKKFLIIRYMGYDKRIKGSYLEIINTYINWGKLWTALFALAFIIPFSIVGGCLFYHKYYKLKCKKRNSCIEPQSTTDFNAAPNYSSNNPDFDDKETYDNENGLTPQKDNIYYELTKSAYDTHDDVNKIN